MLSEIKKRIIVRALQLRKEAGEEPQEILSGYKNLTEEEKTEILKEIGESVI